MSLLNLSCLSIALILTLSACRMTNSRPNDLKGAFGSDPTPFPSGARPLLLVDAASNSALTPHRLAVQNRAITWQEASCTRAQAVATNIDTLLAAPITAEFEVKTSKSTTGVLLNLESEVDIGSSVKVTKICIPADSSDQRETLRQEIENLGNRPLIVFRHFIVTAGKDGREIHFAGGGALRLPDLSGEQATVAPASIMGFTWTQSFWSHADHDGLAVEARVVFTLAPNSIDPNSPVVALLSQAAPASALPSLPRLHREIKHIPRAYPRKP